MSVDVTRPHVEPELLEQYCLGRLHGEVLDAVEEHLLVCEHCQQNAIELEEKLPILKQALLEWPKREQELRERKDARRPLVRLWLTAAAAIVGMVVLPLAYQSGKSPVHEGTLTAYRAQEVLQVPAGRVDLLIEADGLDEAPQYHVELAREGDIVWQRSMGRRELRVRPEVELRRGDYRVRVFAVYKSQDPSRQNELLSEMMLKIN